MRVGAKPENVYNVFALPGLGGYNEDDPSKGDGNGEPFGLFVRHFRCVDCRNLQHLCEQHVGIVIGRLVRCLLLEIYYFGFAVRE